MCSTHWPKLIDLTRDEAKRTLRRLELDAYASVITAFRAQGDLSKEKKKLLQELQANLSISIERHRAEIRRAVNDEKLTTIADHMSGPNVSAEWLIEGRRLVPLMPRLVPQTAFTITANNAANAQAEKNVGMPQPTNTGKDINAPPPPPSTTATPTPVKTSGRPQSPPANVVILPSGMSIHIKGGLSTEEQELIGPPRKRMPNTDVLLSKPLNIPHSMSVAASKAEPKSSAPSGSTSAGPSVASPTVTSQPMRVTVTKSPGKTQPPVPTSQPPQKVVVMTTASSNISVTTTQMTTATPNILTTSSVPPQMSYPKPVATPGARPVTMATSSMYTPKPVVMPTATAVASAVVSSVVTSLVNVAAASTIATSGVVMSTMAASGMDVPRNMVTITTTSVPATFQTQVTGSHITAQKTVYPRTRTIITRPRTPYVQNTGGHQRSTIVIPSASGSTQGTPVHPSPQIIKSMAKPAIHIKQEGSMKIITQLPASASGTPGAKVVPRYPSGGSSVVVVSTGQSTPAMAQRVSTPGGKILNISSSATRVISTTRPHGSNVVVNPKSFHITSVKGTSSGTVLSSTGPRIPTPAGTKPNVIVVQKAAHHGPRKVVTAVSQAASTSHTQQVPTPRTPPSGAIQSPFEKELVSFIQRQDSQSRQVLTQQQRGERRLAPKSEMLPTGQTPQAKKITVVRQKADGTTSSQPIVITQGTAQAGKSSILAELISAVQHPLAQADGQRQSDSEILMTEDQQAVAAITGAGEAVAASKESSMLQNQWVEMDAPLDQAQVLTSDTNDASAIKALLDLQQGQPGPSKVKVRRESQQRSGVYETQQGLQVPQSEVITIDQSGNIVQQVVPEGTSDSGSIQYIQTQHGPMKIKKQGGVELSSAGQAVQIEEELPSSRPLVNRDIIGELDPNTGILYANSPFDGQQIISAGEISSITPLHQAALATSSMAMSSTSLVMTQPKVISSQTEAIRVSSGGVVGDRIIKPQQQVEGKATDFLSAALEQSDVSLEPYQHMEPTELSAAAATKLSRSRPQEVVVQGRRLSLSQSEAGLQEVGGGLVRVISSASASAAASTSDVESSGSLEVGLESSQDTEESSSASSRVPDVIADVISTQPSTTIRVGQGQVKIAGSTLVSKGGRPHFISLQETSNRAPHTISIVRQTSQPGTSSMSLESSQPPAVAVESTGIDPTNFQLAELTSQKYEGETSYSAEEQAQLLQQGMLGSPSAGSSQDSLSDSMNKRKRKPPPKPDEIITQSQVGGWARLAQGLLQKVSKYRGLYKQKGDMNAASWFTHPVDPSEVPDYYTIIQTPMDFSTIKKKLETGAYNGWNDFHSDMMLIRDNCYQYNPEGTEVRMDCDEVFAYYIPEYDKTLQKWQQMQLGSPTSKKPRLDRSPVRSQTFQ